MTVIATAQDIDAKIDEMAGALIDKYKATQPVFLCLLRGGVPFASKLMFALTRRDPDFYPRVEYITASTYGATRQAHAATELAASHLHNFAGEHVVILDDVLDTGQTPHTVQQWLDAQGVKQVDVVVLAQKNKPRTHWQEATLYGFLTDDVWLSGMGCDNTSVAPEADRWTEALIGA